MPTMMRPSLPWRMSILDQAETQGSVAADASAAPLEDEAADADAESAFWLDPALNPPEALARGTLVLSIKRPPLVPPHMQAASKPSSKPAVTAKDPDDCPPGMDPAVWAQVKGLFGSKGSGAKPKDATPDNIKVKIRGEPIEKEKKLRKKGEEKSPAQKDKEAFAAAHREIRRLRRKYPNLGAASVSVKPGSGEATVTIETLPL